MTAQEFIQGLERLQLKVPRPALFQDSCMNSPYSNYVGNCKNCYLSFGDADGEDCYYTRWCFRNKDSGDMDNVEDGELNYECLDSSHCYDCNFLQDCENCTDCSFGYNLIGCKNCIGCVGLRQKEYQIFNQPVTKEVFQKAKSQLWLHRAEIEKRLQELKAKAPHVYAHQKLTEACTGDYIFRSKNCLTCFDTWDCQDCMYLLSCYDLKDCLDTNFIAGKGSELNYELLSGWFTTNTNFCYACWHAHDLEYCELCFNSHDLFGCVGLNHKEYCILNQQYSKEEYFAKVAEIKDNLKKENLYGRFFLPSSFPYEDSLAASFYQRQ